MCLSLSHTNKANDMTRFEQTYQEIKSAYLPVSNARPIYFEYVSDYRRIVVLGKESGFEIRTEYKGFAKEFCKTWSTHWGQKDHAIAWAKCYAANRNIVCGNLTITEKIGKQII